MQTPDHARRPCILVVDDEPTNLQVLRQILQDDHRLLFAKDGQRAVALARQELPQLILLDVMMPDMTGIEVCRALKSEPATRGIPVIFVTALGGTEDEASGFDAGAVDYVTKPVSAPIVKARVRTHLSLVRADELRETRMQIIQRLGLAAEYKDNETGLHVIRMSHYARIVAQAAGWSEAAAEELQAAAPMHDIGKIGIPDAILLKPGPLTDEEWQIMRRHPLIGAEIIGDHPSSLLRMARNIALAHHEKFDGSGYPHGLAGEAIPIEARIVAVVDVFDALTTARPYKTAWSVEDALETIKRDAGRHFDPDIVRCLLQEQAAILAVKDRWKEEDAGVAAASRSVPRSHP